MDRSATEMRLPAATFDMESKIGLSGYDHLDRLRGARRLEAFKQGVTMSDADRTHTSSRLIAANSACIYDACIQPAKLTRWIAPAGAEAEVEAFEAREGGHFKIILSFRHDIGKSSSRTDVVSGRFLRLVPGERIVQAIDFVSDRPEFAGTMIMSWLLQPSGDDTLVTVVAENVPRGIGKSDHQAGMASSLENLARLVQAVCDR